MTFSEELRAQILLMVKTSRRINGYINFSVFDKIKTPMPARSRRIGRVFGFFRPFFFFVRFFLFLFSYHSYAPWPKPVLFRFAVVSTDVNRRSYAQVSRVTTLRQTVARDIKCPDPVPLQRVQYCARVRRRRVYPYIPFRRSEVFRAVGT